MNLQPRSILIAIVALFLLREGAQLLGWTHFQPYLALLFCLAAFAKPAWLLVVLAGYLLTNLSIGAAMGWWVVALVLGFGFVMFWGNRFRGQNHSWTTLMLGSAGGAVAFYLITSLVSWLTLGRYSLNFDGFIQAFWTGLPGDPSPTWAFFRNSLVSTLLYTAMLLAWFRVPFTHQPKLQTNEAASLAS